MKVNLLENELAMWVVCESIKDEFKHTHMVFDNSHNGEHEIKFTVDGVELNFVNFINRLHDIYNEVVDKRAGERYIEEFDQRSNEIAEELCLISERLKEIRKTKFPEVNWVD